MVVQVPVSVTRVTRENEVAIRSIDPVNEPGWNEKVLRFPRATFFHSSAWCRVLQETYRFRPAYLVAEEGEELCGLLPLMEADNWPKGRRGLSLPFTDECESLSFKPQIQQQLFDAAVDAGKRRGWKYLETRGGKELLPNFGASVSFFGHHLELESDENRMFARFEGSVQRSVRRAIKAGLQIEVARSLEGIRTFYRLHARTRRKHGAPPQSFKFFQAIFEQIVDCGYGFTVIAKLGTKPVAAAIFFHFGSRAIFKYGASDERFQHFRGNNLVMWEGICRLARLGCSELDFGRTSTRNEGLRRFKLGWSGSESRINYFKYDLKKESFVRILDRASGWQSRLFRLFPVTLSRCVGALLYPRLA